MKKQEPFTVSENTLVQLKLQKKQYLILKEKDLDMEQI